MRLPRVEAHGDQLRAEAAATLYQGMAPPVAMWPRVSVLCVLVVGGPECFDFDDVWTTTDDLLDSCADDVLDATALFVTLMAMMLLVLLSPFRCGTHDVDCLVTELLVLTCGAPAGLEEGDIRSRGPLGDGVRGR